MRLFTFYIIAFFTVSTTVYGQDSDSTGQDFDLEALMGVIETVDDFEALEKVINDSTSDVNNLDLNGDGNVDYVLIQEEADGDVHVAFLRVPMAEDEYQDVATIEMEKLSSTTASFQIVGDVDLYGADYIIEPDSGIVDISDSGVEQGGKGGPSYIKEEAPVVAVRVTLCVGVYRPGYAVYVSPYGFMVVPVWYHPYRRVARTTYRRRCARWHRTSYHRTAHRRSHYAHNTQKKHHHSSKTYQQNKQNKATSNNNKNNVNNNQNKSNVNTNQNKNNTNKNTNQHKNTQQKRGGGGGRKK